jgi:phosphoglucomutase
MSISPLAGKPAPKELLIDPAQLENDYFNRRPEMSDPEQHVAFGTSGHRGTSANGTFTESHILAVTQAICDYRKTNGITGPLIMGKDTHALSRPSERTALRVLAANGVETIIQSDDEVTPTPVISHAILKYNANRKQGLADGIVNTPSHNPPGDGGFKYNPPNGGPADTDVTEWIQNRANTLLRENNHGVKQITIEDAFRSPVVHVQDFMIPYVHDLQNVVDMESIKNAKLKMAVDPLGGASMRYWNPINEIYGLDVAVLNTSTDPTFSFMTVDHDGKIRMDCSSVYAMKRMMDRKDDYLLSFGNDPDADRFGIITPTAGLLNPNHFLAVAIAYLLSHRPNWSPAIAVGKTVLSSSLIDRVVLAFGRKLTEVPVGFKWFASGLFEGSLCFAGEESAGASFLRKDATVWTTDKDGLIMDLLAAEMTATTGSDPGEHYQDLSAKLGNSFYTRIDAAATPDEKSRLKKLSSDSVKALNLAGEPITEKITRAPGNRAAIGGLKVVSSSGWFAARPSGTENVYKIYAESFKDESHLQTIVEEAQKIVGKAIEST